MRKRLKQKNLKSRKPAKSSEIQPLERCIENPPLASLKDDYDDLSNNSANYDDLDDNRINNDKNENNYHYKAHL